MPTFSVEFCCVLARIWTRQKKKRNMVDVIVFERDENC